MQESRAATSSVSTPLSETTKGVPELRSHEVAPEHPLEGLRPHASNSRVTPNHHSLTTVQTPSLPRPCGKESSCGTGPPRERSPRKQPQPSRPVDKSIFGCYRKGSVQLKSAPRLQGPLLSRWLRSAPAEIEPGLRSSRANAALAARQRRGGSEDADPSRFPHRL